MSIKEADKVVVEQGVEFLCEIKRDDLLRMLSGVQAVVNRKATNSILANILIRAQDDVIKIMGTGPDLSVINSSPSNTGSYGEVSVMGSMLFDICRKLPQGCSVVLSKLENKETLDINAGTAIFNLPTMDSESFPKIEALNSDDAIKMSCENCFKLLDRVSFAIANDEARQFLCGAYFSITKKGEISVVATNGHRLAMMTANSDAGVREPRSAIIPRRTVFEVMRHAYLSPKEEVKIVLEQNRVDFFFPNTVIISKLISGHYPDVNKIIPARDAPRCEVRSSAFLGSIERVSAVLLDKNGGVSLNIANNEMLISARTLEYGSSASEKMTVSYEGPPVTVTLNTKYLSELITKCPSVDFIFYISSSESPVLCLSDSMPEFLCVIMPMRI